MEQRPALDRTLRTAEGRFRLWWRLALFVVITASVASAIWLVLPGWSIAGSIALLLGSLTGGAILLALDGRAPGALGFYVKARAGAETLLGLCLGTAVALGVVGSMFVLGGLRWTAQEGSIVEWMTSGLGAVGFLAIPAAAEEALLRGYPLQALAEAWGAPAALALTAALFGAMHLANPNVTFAGVLNMLLAGVFLGFVYLRTASLWWATGVHVGWNWATGYIADVPVSGLEILDAPLYDGVPRGPEWLGGGAFGPEGSLIATAILVVAAAWCWRTRWLRPSDAALAAHPLAYIRRGVA